MQTTVPRPTTTTQNASLPARYQMPWREQLLEVCGPLLQPGCAILDIGSGRTPAIKPKDRPDDCTYVGLDISRHELERAPDDSYTERLVGDATIHDPALDGRFDIVVTWQVLEHVTSTQGAIDAMYAYLKPGGLMVSMLSGKNSLFAIPNRIIPHRLAVWSMEKLLNRRPDSVFPARYDLCSYSELTDALRGWSQAEVRCFWRGAGYLGFALPIQRAYVGLENRLMQRDMRDFATHYLIVARK